jgi:paired amphipathic helix protein Sin3a
MGTTVSPMGGTIKMAGEGRINGIVPPPAPYDPARPGEAGWPHQSLEQIDGMLDPAGRTLESLFAHQPGANQARLSPFDSTGRDVLSGPMLAQQERNNVAQLQNAAAMATNDAMIRQMAAASPLPDLNSPMAQNGAAGMEKRGPVEFNHAISYVNKIKVSLT